MAIADRLRGVRTVALSAAGTLALLPAAAQGATVEIAPTTTGPQLKVTALAGEANDIQITMFQADGYWVSDPSGAPVTALGKACKQSSATLVTCTAAGLDSALATLGDGDDKLWFPIFFSRATVLGGDGNDVLRGPLFTGGALLDGGAGDDVLAPGSGSQDRLVGGGGFDKADYRARSSALTLAADGTASSGASLEADTIGTDVEGLEGGRGADVLLGSSGNDFLHGYDGDDRLDAGAGDDAVHGGNGNDRLDGGAGLDVLTSGAGDDTVISRDGGQVDDVQCGDGIDAVTGDREDSFSACETTDVPPAPVSPEAPQPAPAEPAAPAEPGPAPAEPAAPAEAAPAPAEPAAPAPAVAPAEPTIADLGAPAARLASPVTITVRQLQIDAKGKLPVVLRCAAAQAGGCRGEIVITVARALRGRTAIAAGSAKPIVLARVKFALKPGQSRRVLAKVSRRGVKQAFGAGKQANARPRGRRIKAAMSVSTRAADGSRTTVTTPVTITVPRV